MPFRRSKSSSKSEWTCFLSFEEPHPRRFFGTFGGVARRLPIILLAPPFLNVPNQHGAAVWRAPCGHPSTHPSWGASSSSFSFVVLSGTPRSDGGFRQPIHLGQPSALVRQTQSLSLAAAVRDRVSGPCHSGLGGIHGCDKEEEPSALAAHVDSCRRPLLHPSLDGAGCTWRHESRSAPMPVPVSPTTSSAGCRKPRLRPAALVLFLARPTGLETRFVCFVCIKFSSVPIVIFVFCFCWLRFLRYVQW